MNDWVTTGVPLARGTGVTSAANLMVTDGTGAIVPSMITVTSRWGGAPSDATKEIKWVLLDFQPSVSASSTATYYLKDRVGADPTPGATVTVTTDSSYITVNTGAGGITAKIRTDKFTLLDSVTLNSNSAIIVSAGSTSDFHVTAGGVTYSSANATGYSATVEYPGNPQSVGEAMRGQIRVKGAFSDGTSPKCLFDVRLLFYAGSPVVKVQATYILDQDAFVFKPSDLALSLPLNLSGPLTFTSGATSFSMNGTTDDGYVVQSDYNAYAIYKNASSQATGTTSTGWADLSNGSNGLTVYMRDMWQNFPNEIEANGTTLNAHLWPVHADLVTEVNAKITANTNTMFPYQPSNLMDLTAAYASGGTRHDITAVNALGLAKTWELMYYFHGATADSAGSAARFQNFLIGMNAAQFCSSLAVEPCEPYATTADTFAGVSRLTVENALDTVYSKFVTSANNYHVYGSFVYGDIFYSPIAFTDRYWNQGNIGWQMGPLTQFIRTGEQLSTSRKYLDFAYAAIEHNMDVDRQHVTKRITDARGNDINKVVGGCNQSVSEGVAHWYDMSDVIGRGGTNPDWPTSHCVVGPLATLYFLTGYGRAYDLAIDRINTVAAVVTAKQYPATAYTLPAGRGIPHILDPFVYEIDLTGDFTHADAFWTQVATWNMTPAGMPTQGESPDYAVFTTHYMIDCFYQYALRKSDSTVTAKVMATLQSMLGMGQIASPPSSGVRGYQSIQPIGAGAYAYTLSPDSTTRSWLYRRFQMMFNSQYFLGSALCGSGVQDDFHCLLRMSLAMKALKNWNGYVEPLHPIQFVNMPSGATVTLKARESSDTSWTFTLAMECDIVPFGGQWAACAAATIDVKSPGGGSVTGYPLTWTPPNLNQPPNSAVWPLDGTDQRYRQFTVPVDGATGDYQIQITQTGAPGVQHVALADCSLARCWMMLPAGGATWDNGVYWFNVPNTTGFSVLGPPYYYTVVKADGTVVHSYGTAAFTPTASQVGLWQIQYFGSDVTPAPKTFDLSGSSLTRDVSFSAATHPGATAGFSAYDINQDGLVNVVDAQLVVYQALGLMPCGAGNVNRDGRCDILDVLLEIGAVITANAGADLPADFGYNSQRPKVAPKGQKRNR